MVAQECQRRCFTKLQLEEKEKNMVSQSSNTVYARIHVCVCVLCACLTTALALNINTGEFMAVYHNNENIWFYTLLPTVKI